MDKNKKLLELKDELAELDPIVERRFLNSRDLQKHIEENKKAYLKANEIFLEIKLLEFELMTPEQQEKEIDALRLMKLKRDGKL